MSRLSVLYPSWCACLRRNYFHDPNGTLPTQRIKKTLLTTQPFRQIHSKFFQLQHEPQATIKSCMKNKSTVQASQPKPSKDSTRPRSCWNCTSHPCTPALKLPFPCDLHTTFIAKVRVSFTKLWMTIFSRESRIRLKKYVRLIAEKQELLYGHWVQVSEMRASCQVVPKNKLVTEPWNSALFYCGKIER